MHLQISNNPGRLDYRSIILCDLQNDFVKDAHRRLSRSLTKSYLPSGLLPYRADWICPPAPGCPPSGPAMLRTHVSSYRMASNPNRLPKNTEGAALRPLRVSGRLDLNQRLQVPQTCTLNPCATARCYVLGRTLSTIAHSSCLVNKSLVLSAFLGFTAGIII